MWTTVQEAQQGHTLIYKYDPGAAQTRLHVQDHMMFQVKCICIWQVVPCNIHANKTLHSILGNTYKIKNI